MDGRDCALGGNASGVEGPAQGNAAYLRVGNAVEEDSDGLQAGGVQPADGGSILPQNLSVGVRVNAAQAAVDLRLADDSVCLLYTSLL